MGRNKKNFKSPKYQFIRKGSLQMNAHTLQKGSKRVNVIKECQKGKISAKKESSRKRK